MTWEVEPRMTYYAAMLGEPNQSSRHKISGRTAGFSGCRCATLKEC